MKDITGKEIKIGDTVVVPLDKRELRIGKVTKIASVKIKVESNVIDGYFYPTAMLIIDEKTKEIQKTIIFSNGDEEVVELSVEDAFKRVLQRLNIEEKDVMNDNFEKGEDFIYFAHNNIHYEIEPLV